MQNVDSIVYVITGHCDFAQQRALVGCTTGGSRALWHDWVFLSNGGAWGKKNQRAGSNNGRWGALKMAELRGLVEPLNIC